MQVIQPIKTHKLKIVASIALLILCITLYYICKIPVISYAYEPTLTRTGTTTLQADVATSLEIVLPATSTVLSVTPTSEGAFTSTDLVVKVATDNPTGYTLTMTAASSSLSRSTAVNGVTPTIQTLSSATTSTNAADFPNDRWGFRRVDGQFADTVYHPITTGAVNINTSGIPSNINDASASNTINFATKLTNATMSGLYEVDLNFVAITNYVLPSTVHMQDFNAVIADSLAPGITYTTKDSRDNQDYTVAKLADGNIWMTKNLNLAGGTTITSANSNVAENYTLPNSTFGGFDAETNENGYVYNSGSTDCASSVGCYSYYSYYSATAKSGLNISTGGVSAPYDICPKGWRMPRSPYGAVPTNEFYNLALAYGMPEGKFDGYGFQDVIQAIGPGTVPNFVLNGYAYNQLEQLNESGSYRSSTFMWYSGNEKRSGKFYFSPADGYYISTSMGLPMREGTAVRCIKDRSMQNFSATDTAAMSEGQTITLVDSRDNKEYKVTKINGRVWMTENLRFTGTTLTPADSNVSENTTMTYYSLDSTDASYANHCDSTNGLSNACIKDSGSADTGVFYNYYAASANTSDGATSAALTSSICPKGWEIPSDEIYRSLGIYQDQNQLPLFKIRLDGEYEGGALEYVSTYGVLWSSTPSSTVAALTRFRRDTYQDYDLNGGNISKDRGANVRCIFSGE